VALPNPLPDNPTRWDGWKNYNSPNYYERLCLDFDSNASVEQIEDNCRRLLIWWQKKLPLKNQPSNPAAQLLRGGLDEAPLRLAEARTELLNPESRARLDAELRTEIVAAAVVEFKKILSFVLSDKKLTEEGERRLFDAGREAGLGDDEIKTAIDGEVERLGAARVASISPPTPVTREAAITPSNGTTNGTSETSDPFAEFRRILRMSRLALDGEEMTDDQRDAMCNVGESLGLAGGEAEDLIDEYLDEMNGLPPTPVAAAGARAAVMAAPVKSKAVEVGRPVIKPCTINTSPLARAQEKQKYANFTNSISCEMLLVTSGQFEMGSVRGDASPQEQPVTKVTVGCFYMARLPVTNAQYEAFDPTHRGKRGPWADDRHPVIYVSSQHAEKFCQWLTQKEGRKYRLPTEAEWEYAARGLEGRVYPWGDELDAGFYANFADSNTTFAWRDTGINDGFAETAPVGSYPRGASPFGIEDLSGNVFEWCLDCFEPYRGKDIVNRRGPINGTQRIYRGGSWRSKASSLRATARHFNMPNYASSDVGFRLLCETE
jgi:formylglycine-generating enzyme required for sulfatase activity